MGFTLSFQKSESRNFEPLPTNWYEVEIDDVYENVARTGTEYIRLDFRITEEGPFKNRHVWSNLYNSERALWKFRAFLFAVGIDVPEGEPFHLDLEQLKGKRLKIRVRTTAEGPGESTSEVIGFRRTSKPPDDDLCPF